jgi:polysaccharide pyruvyl transferase WcaK-like protein
MDVLGKWPLSELTPLVCGASDQNKPVVFIGSGVEALQREESRQTVAERIAPAVNHWTVRSARDKQRLTEYGVDSERVTVAADLAWTLEATGPASGRGVLDRLGVRPGEYLVGVNLTNERFVTETQPRLFERVAEYLDALVDRYRARIIFLANEVREDEAFDTAASQMVIAGMKHRQQTLLVRNEYRSPQEMMSLIACCDLTLSMRYHFCLFSALQGVPFIAVKRSDKVDDLCWDMDWSYGVSLADLNTSDLLEMHSELEQDRNAATASLRARVDVMRSRAMKNIAALDAIAAGR